MAWPAEAGSLGVIRRAPGAQHARRPSPASRVLGAPPPAGPVYSVRADRRGACRRPRRGSRCGLAAGRGSYILDARGLYRIFNAAEYRFYRSSTGPPAESDSPFATNASLPYTPADVFADGIWWLSVSYFNGVLDSGFLPLGPRGETYLRLDLAGGAETDGPPPGPQGWHIEQLAGGVVRVVGVYFDSAAERADSWTIAYTTDGDDPPEDTADVVETMEGTGLSFLAYDLPAQPAGTTLKVRLQTRRDGVYSEDSTVEQLVVETQVPVPPIDGEHWPGRLPATED